MGVKLAIVGIKTSRKTRLKNAGKAPVLCQLAVLLAAIFTGSAVAQESTGNEFPSQKIAERLQQYADLAVQWSQAYFRIDTTNPPGNEIRATEFFKKILDAEGIENQVFEYAPGRADLWARVPHSTEPAQRPIILLNHMDVVTSEPAHWKVPPFSGQILDGAIYGRGAQDMKDEGIAQLLALVMLKREKIALDRDVIFLAVADEEVASTGTDWFIAHHRELLENAEFLINEGGENILDQHGKLKYMGVAVAQKSPLWLHVVAHGQPGHGSVPLADSAPNRLIAALSRIIAYHSPPKVTPIVEEALRDMAPYQTGKRAEQFRNIREAIRDKEFQTEIERDETLNFLFHNTTSLTMLGGSEQTNVIPGEAWANLDVRLLPGEDPKQFLGTIRQVVNDPQVTVEPQDSDFRVSNSSPTDTALFNAFVRVSAHYFPGAPVTPQLTSGYDESQRYRPLGIHSYGFNPYTATQQENDTQHGDNERIRVSEVRRGFQVMYDVVASVAGKSN